MYSNQLKYFKTDKGKRANLIAQWKRVGVLHPDLHLLYDKTYLPCDECDNCGHDFSIHKKCLDHSHLWGVFRNVLCFRCNVHDSWEKFKIEDGVILHRLFE